MKVQVKLTLAYSKKNLSSTLHNEMLLLNFTKVDKIIDLRSRQISPFPFD